MDFTKKRGNQKKETEEYITKCMLLPDTLADRTQETPSHLNHLSLLIKVNTDGVNQ